MSHFLALAVVSALSGFQHVLAADSGSTATQSSPASGGLLIGFLIAYLSRRAKIGGWLLYFYMQLYGSFLLTIIVFSFTIGRLQPSHWSSANLYVWYLLGTVPSVLIEVAEVVTASYLLARRTAANVQFLRHVLLAVVIVYVVTTAIDAIYFADAATLALDGFALFFSLIWFAYFYRSVRVRLVFIEHTWNYAGSKPIPNTPLERRYLRKRALVCAVLAFVAFLIVIGSTLGDKKPDAYIFFVPAFYAVVAGLLGWFLPIRKKKRAALAASVASSVE